jgi:hypothetical protein
MNTPHDRTDRVNRFLEAGIWLLFFALLVPVGFAGYEIGRATAAPAPTAHHRAAQELPHA